MPSKADDQGSKTAHFEPKKPTLKATRVVSYEDMLVAQYLEELRKTPPYTKPTHKVPVSPYAQKLAQPQVFLSPGRLRDLIEINKKNSHRPKSASTYSHASSSNLTPSSSKPKIDPKFIADPDKWDPATPRSERDKRMCKKRPGSAPIGGRGSKRPQSAPNAYRRGLRPTSAKSISSLSTTSRGRRYKTLYKRQPHVLKVTAYKNGTRDVFCKAAAPNIKLLLEMVTDKLGLPQAARRIYLESGQLVTCDSDIPKDADVYISMGEKFKNPLANAVQNAQMKSGVTWTMNGLVLPDEGKKKTTKPHLTKRFNSSIEKKTVRIMVYKNGKATNGLEVIADPKNWLGFLDLATCKLDMGSPAKMAYDWEGNEVQSVDQLPMLDNCLQSVATSPSFGPVWMSKGEGFSPSGAQQFILNLLQYSKKKLDEAEQYKTQLNYFHNEKHDKVTIVSILSMTDEEVYEALDSAENDIDEFNAAIKNLRKQLRKLAGCVRAEQDEGVNYTMQHIQKLDTSNRLIGVQGLKLKVYQNGIDDNEVTVFFNMKEASKGTGGDPSKIFERLLDQLSSSCRTSKGDSGPRGALIRRIFTTSGKEIIDARELENEQEIWVSYGENFKVPYVLSLQMTMDRVRSVVMSGIDKGVMHERRVAYREQLMVDDIAIPGRDKPHSWQAVVGVPDECVSSHIDKTNNPFEAEQVSSLMALNEIDVNSHFLQCKDDPELLLYPELSVGSKKRRGAKELWPSEAQIWVITKAGYIYSKAMPQFVLTTLNSPVNVQLPSGVGVHGYGVTLCKKFPGSPHQIWRFTGDGQLVAESNPELVLTFLGGSADSEDTIPKNDVPGCAPGNRFFLAVTEKLPVKEQKYQRWAIKQERFDNLGQWKHSRVKNPEWNKLAYSWPVDEDGNLIENFDWPMEGYFIPNAPPIKPVNCKNSQVSTMIPMRLTVMKNGDRDNSLAIPIVGPDLTNMMKDMHKTHKNGNKHKTKKSHDSNDDDSKDSVSNEQHLHCEGLTLHQLEFMLFLEHCTSMVGLPFAARRLFDEDGREHFTLQELKRDQLVYVSCGEAWTDPKLTKAEQQRRFLLSNLAADVAQIRQYVALRNPEGYVLEVEGGLTPSARIIVNEHAMSVEEYEEQEARRAALEEQRLLEANAELERHERETYLKELIDEKKSAHDRAHARSDERIQNLKWPWERLVDEPEAAADDPDEIEKQKSFSNKELYKKYRSKPKQSPRYPRLHLQKFTYVDGFIATSSKPDLVLGLQESEGRAPEVVLVKKRYDDIHQRWLIDGTGLIRAKHNSRFVMSVSMPTNMRKEDESISLSYAGSPVLLQQHKGVQFGRANQKFYFNADTGMIHAFQTDILDKEITSANKANICTFSITGDLRMDQPGYRVEVESPSNKNKSLRLLVCSSCARAMRGRYKAEKISRNVDFACAMGTAKERKIKQIGSFQCLNGKVDLSSHEAEHTLDEWNIQLDRLRQETSVRAIAREISQARIPRTVKILVYKNGEGRMKEGQIVYASSINGLLQQATVSLQFRSAARRIYTESGAMILDIDDLINWAVESYITDMKRIKLSAIRRARKNQMAKDTNKELPEGIDVDSNQTSTNSGPVEIRTLMEKVCFFNSNTNLLKDEGDIEAEINEIDENNEEDAWLAKANGEPEINAISQEMAPPEDGQLSAKERPKKKKRSEAEILAGIEVNIPEIDVILQQPIEVWASTGDHFIKPEAAEGRVAQKMQQREERALVSQELEKEKHILRQMQGRRLEEKNPGEYHMTNDPEHPIIIEGSWQEPSHSELEKHDAVHQLQTHLSEMKVVQNDTESLKTVNAAVSRRLYGQPKMKRVLAYPNGESIHRAVYVWGESFQQIVDNATMRLNLKKSVKILYDVTGRVLKTFADIERDMIVCVSTGKAFMKIRDQKDEIEIKANWSRARKQYGPNATNISVAPHDLPNVDVDPFGPPVLAGSSANDSTKTSKRPPRPKTAKRPQAPPTSTEDDVQFLNEL
ncbi:doublecortin domain-containing protein 1-like isoform X2 [Tubulanus polymorphus]|uniref:doublecortin domain-containing protein 1-like isoform X2 n=1 Tax=Tubulanus polymorphus TaxID=672921 RepID=UPI003DA4BFC1